jgi:DtxR family transcriptional regulator, manganese transport regulator
MSKESAKQAEAIAGERFLSVRDSHAQETAEDYVEAIAETLQRKGICRGVDLAKEFCVSHVTVTKIMVRLQSEGLVAFESYGPYTLTAAGTRLAALTKRRHVVVLEFLRALGISEGTAQVDAEGMEHHVSSETLEAFKSMTNTLNKKLKTKIGSDLETQVPPTKGSKK